MKRGWYLLGTFLNILFSFLQFKTIWQIQVAFPRYYYFFLIKEEVSQKFLPGEQLYGRRFWGCMVALEELLSEYCFLRNYEPIFTLSCFFEKNQNQKLSCIHSFLCYCSQTLFCTRMITNFKTSQTTPPLFS